MQSMIKVGIGQQKCRTEKKSGLFLPKVGGLVPDSFMTTELSPAAQVELRLNYDDTFLIRDAINQLYSSS
jgi:hypothetical protein